MSNKIKKIKQGYRDEIGRLRATIRELKNRPAPKAPAPPKVDYSPYTKRISALEKQLSRQPGVTAAAVAAERTAQQKAARQAASNRAAEVANTLSAMRSQYSTSLETLTSQYGLKISDLQENVQSLTQGLGQQKTDYEKKLADQTSGFKEQFEAQQKGFEALTAAQASKFAETQKIQQANAANAARAREAASVQIQPAGEMPTTAGTQPFKIRPQQFNQGKKTTYGGLSIGKSKLVNV